MFCFGRLWKMQLRSLPWQFCWDFHSPYMYSSDFFSKEFWWKLQQSYRVRFRHIMSLPSIGWGNIFPHVRFQLLVRTSFPTCTVPVCIFELSVPLFPHVQFHPNMHYPFLAHVRSKLHLINNNFIKINDQKIFSRLIMCQSRYMD